MRGFERRQDSFGLRGVGHRLEGVVVGGGRELDAAGVVECGQLWADARVVEARGRRDRLDDLAVAVLEHHRSGAVEDPRSSSSEGGRVAARRDAVARRLSHRKPHRRLTDEPAQEPDCVRAATHAREGEVRQPPLHRSELDGRFIADPPLEIADDRGIRVRAHRGAEHVVRGLHVGDPVAHRLVDRVLEGRAPGVDRAHLGAQRMHAEHVRLLALDVLRAHVHDAWQPEEGAGGRGRDAMLAGPCLRDHARLAEPAREQRLAQCVVDLVRAGVREILALQVQAQARGNCALPRACRGLREFRGCELQDSRREPVRAVERRGPARKRREQLAQLGPEARVVTELVVRRLQLGEGGHERLGDVPATELALESPSTIRIRFEQARPDGGWTRREVRAIGARRASPLHEQGDAQGILPRPHPGDPRRLRS